MASRLASASDKESFLAKFCKDAAYRLRWILSGEGRSTMKTIKKRHKFLHDDIEAPTSNEQRLKEFFIRFEPEILGTLYFLLGTTVVEAEEALNEVFTRCWKSNQIDSVKNERVWIFRTLYTVALEKVKKDRNGRRKKADERSLNDLDERDSESAFISLMRDSISSLTFEERVVLLLRQNGTLSYHQIAQTTGESLDEIKKTMSRAFKKLSASYEENKESVRKSNLERASEFLA